MKTLSFDANRTTYHYFVGLLIGSLIFSSLFLSYEPINLPGIFQKFRVIDLILILSLFAIIALKGQIDWQRIIWTFRRLFIPLILFLLLGGIDLVLRQQWGLAAVNSWSLLFFFFPVFLIASENTVIYNRLILYSILFTQFFLSVWVICLFSVGNIRNRIELSGPFNDPNHTASWLLLSSLLVVLFFPKQLNLLRYFIVSLCLVSILMLDSNSTFLAAAVCIPISTYLLLRNTSISTPGKVLIILGSIAFLPALILGTRIEWQLPSDSGTNEQASSITQSPVESTAPLPESVTFRPLQSSTARIQLIEEGWRAYLQNPLIGTGLDSALADSTPPMANFEFHNEFLTYLVGYGPIGLITLLWLFGAFWQVSNPKARVLLLGITIIALTHSSLSWRHLWIFYGIAVGLSLSKGLSRSNLENH